MLPALDLCTETGSMRVQHDVSISNDAVPSCVENSCKIWAFSN